MYVSIVICLPFIALGNMRFYFLECNILNYCLHGLPDYTCFDEGLKMKSDLLPPKEDGNSEFIVQVLL